MKKNVRLLTLLCIFTGVFSPYQMSAAPVTIKTGVFVVSLNNFNYSGDSFNATFWIWGFLSSRKAEAIYQNGIEFISANEVQKDVEGSIPVPGGTLLQQKYKAEMQHSWNMKNYPFIKDNLFIYFETVSDVSRIMFIPDTEQSGFSNTYRNSEWNIDGFEISASDTVYNTNYGDRTARSMGSTYSRIQVRIPISKKSPWITFFKLTASVYLFFLLSLLPFCMNPDTDSRLSIPCATLFAVVSNQNIVDSMVPTSSTITLLDSIHSLTQITIICIIAILIATNNLQIQRSLASKQRSRDLDRRALLTVPILYAAVNIVLIRGCV
jgi:hypothetical protein